MCWTSRKLLSEMHYIVSAIKWCLRTLFLRSFVCSFSFALQTGTFLAQNIILNCVILVKRTGAAEKKPNFLFEFTNNWVRTLSFRVWVLKMTKQEAEHKWFGFQCVTQRITPKTHQMKPHHSFWSQFLSGFFVVSWICSLDIDDTWYTEKSFTNLSITKQRHQEPNVHRTPNIHSTCIRWERNYESNPLVAFLNLSRDKTK